MYSVLYWKHFWPYFFSPCVVFVSGIDIVNTGIKFSFPSGTHLLFFYSVFFWRGNSSNSWIDIFQIFSFHLFMNICYFQTIFAIAILSSTGCMGFIRIFSLNETLKLLLDCIEQSNFVVWIKPNGYKMNLCKHKQWSKLYTHDTRVRNSKGIT